jgi:acyl-CoA synthetase (AMP-forming)/AMP-acid ligase II
MKDIGAKLLIVEQGSPSPAVAAAHGLAIPVIEIAAPGDGPAGAFEFVGASDGGAAADGGLAGPDDVALLLHTSGTTARPKIVPLSHRNICASARHIRAALELGPADCCLNIMPLFHIHGLIAAVSASLGAGASVYCTPGFNALKFFGWLDDARPSWYTAVPTMHQAILGRAARNRETVANARLRFIRSSSSSLPPRLMAELEAAFDSPVIESYGMTEAAHQMTSNPLPPAGRKPGSVGIAAGPEVAIMGENGLLAEADAVGEVVIRGPNVTEGYENNPKANAEGFTHGWFRTGDQGLLDGDGFLTITGRLKEIINRGGEKISPREVDEVLMDHPAVAQVVTFALPHDKLGEEVAAVVVLRDGAEASENDIRRYAVTRLAAFKTPRKVFFRNEIAKGATGNLQRIGLAEKLGLV